MRHELFQLARDLRLAYLQLHISCSIDTAIKRNEQRTGVERVPREALERMRARFEPPQPDRFAWESCSLEFPNEAPLDDARVAWLCGELWRLWGPAPALPPSPLELQRQREEGRRCNAASHLHGLDLRSRKALGEAVAAAGEAARAAVARQLNERRRELLAAARALLQPPASQAQPQPHCQSPSDLQRQHHEQQPDIRPQAHVQPQTRAHARQDLAEQHGEEAASVPAQGEQGLPPARGVAGDGSALVPEHLQLQLQDLEAAFMRAAAAAAVAEAGGEPGRRA